MAVMALTRLFTHPVTEIQSLMAIQKGKIYYRLLKEQ